MTCPPKPILDSQRNSANKRGHATIRADVFTRSENGSHILLEDIKIGDIMSGIAAMRDGLAEPAL